MLLKAQRMGLDGQCLGRLALVSEVHSQFRSLSLNVVCVCVHVSSVSDSFERVRKGVVNASGLRVGGETCRDHATAGPKTWSPEDETGLQCSKHVCGWRRVPGPAMGLQSTGEQANLPAEERQQPT